MHTPFSHSGCLEVSYSGLFFQMSAFIFGESIYYIFWTKTHLHQGNADTVCVSLFKGFVATSARPTLSGN